MQAKTTGIILHQVKYSDSSSIVSIYTREFGRVAYAVRGVGKKRSVCRAALLRPLSVVEIDVMHSPRKEIQTIREMRVAIPLGQLPYDPVKSGVALFVAELLHKTVRHAERDELLYTFIEHSVCRLDALAEGIGNFHLVFMAGLSKRLGFAPDTFNGADRPYFDMKNGVFRTHRPEHTHFLEGDKAALFKALMEMDYHTLSEVPMNRHRRAEALNHFLDYYRLHIAGFQTVKSIDVLHSLWD